MAKILGRHDIDAASDKQATAIPVPEWGGEVLIRPISALERETWENEVLRRQKAGEPCNTLRAELVAIALVDDTGKPLYTREEAILLATRDAGPIDRIFEYIRARAGISDQDVRELEKNFATLRAACSSSTSASS